MFIQFIFNGLVAGFGYALVALSFALIYRPTKFFHFAHAGVFAWGAYLCYACQVVLGLPIWIAIPSAVIGSGVLGILLEGTVFQPMRRRGANTLVLLFASLGLYGVLQGLISFFFGDGVRSLGTGPVVEGVYLFGGRITPIQIVSVCVSAACVSATVFVLKFTRWGKVFRAVVSDPDLAYVQGVESGRVTLAAFGAGSALAGLAAILVALDVDMTPTMGLMALMMGVVAVIIGGVDSVLGTLLGGLLLGLAQHIGVWKLGSQWQQAIAFAVLIIFLLLRPQGILGKRLRRASV